MPTQDSQRGLPRYRYVRRQYMTCHQMLFEFELTPYVLLLGLESSLTEKRTTVWQGLGFDILGFFAHMQWHSQYSKQLAAMQPCRFQFAVSRLFCRHLAVAINGVAESTMHNWLRVPLRQRSHSSELTNDEFTYNATTKFWVCAKWNPPRRIARHLL